MKMTRTRVDANRNRKLEIYTAPTKEVTRTSSSQALIQNKLDRQGVKTQGVRQIGREDIKSVDVKYYNNVVLLKMLEKV